MQNFSPIPNFFIWGCLSFCTALLHIVHNVLAASPAVAAITDFRAGYKLSNLYYRFCGATAAVAPNSLVNCGRLYTLFQCSRFYVEQQYLVVFVFISLPISILVKVARYNQSSCKFIYSPRRHIVIVFR